ncbi:MAG: HNH endonuclease [Candidatus Nealsonbacteria bacterium]|nr:HNH endonuclease [Candidatus Nealsonbacteria bacterium]
MHRERWPTTSEFEIDHLIPVSDRSDLKCRYGNLLYVCRRCNSLKTDLRIPDPCSIAYGECLHISEDGAIEALNEEGRTLVRTLQLDRPERVRQRRMIIEVLSVVEETGDTQRQNDWLGFPEDLEDLARLNPPSNERPMGIEESFFARRRRGELPETY